MDKNFLTESDFKYIKHPKHLTIEKIEYEDFQIYKKTSEEYLADIVYFNIFIEKENEVFKERSDNYVSEFYINVKATCKMADSKTKRTVTLQVDLNALTLKSLTRFCIESKSMDIIDYITNRSFYFDKANQNLSQISNEYADNAIIQSTLKSIFTKMAAKQTLENFKKCVNFTCETDNSLQKACCDIPKATNFNYNNEIKQYTFEKTFYDNDKRCKTTYSLYNRDDHIIYEVNNYVLTTAYTLIGGFKVDTKSNEISFRTIKVIDGEKYFIDREYENKKLVYTFIGDEHSKTLK